MTEIPGLAKKIKIQMIELGINTNEALASELGMTTSKVYATVLNDRVSKVSDLQAISEFLNISVAELLGETIKND